MADNTSNPAQRAIFSRALIQLRGQDERVRRRFPNKLPPPSPSYELTASRFDFAMRPLAVLEAVAF